MRTEVFRFGGDSGLGSESPEEWNGGKGCSCSFTWNTKKGAVALSLNSSEKSGTTISALQDDKPPPCSWWGVPQASPGNKEPDETLCSTTASLVPRHQSRHADCGPPAPQNLDEASESVPGSSGRRPPEHHWDQTEPVIRLGDKASREGTHGCGAEAVKVRRVGLVAGHPESPGA